MQHLSKIKRAVLSSTLEKRRGEDHFAHVAMNLLFIAQLVGPEFASDLSRHLHFPIVAATAATAVSAVMPVAADGNKNQAKIKKERCEAKKQQPPPSPQP